MKAILCLLLLFISFTSPLQAFALDVSGLGALPVQHEGRIKPLDSIARLYWQQFSGNDADATTLLAEALFEPAKALTFPHFRVHSSALRSMLKLPDRKDKSYSYSELVPLLRQHQDAYAALVAKDANQFTATEKALWALFEQVDALTQITSGLSLFLPLESSPSADLRLLLSLSDDASLASYYQLAGAHQGLQEKLKSVIAVKGDVLKDYSSSETELALLAMRLDAIAATGEESTLLRLIPSPISEEWASPWQVLSGRGTPETAEIMQSWQALALAYHSGHQAAWDAALRQLQAALSPFYAPRLIQAEQFYYQLDLINLASFSYAAVVLLAACAAPRFGLWLMGFALAQHGLLLLLRIVILGRPPVTTLYESVLFVSFITALCGACIAIKGARREGLFIGAGVAALLLAISGVYDGAQDSMAMPIAVLNTNFWLATHVIIITAGYGATLLTGGLAHLVLYHPEGASAKYLQTMTLVALLLTSLGTILGGIWADQSWGRFWGWDPKENGALLIVLWLAWLLHARMTHSVGAAGFAALLALSTIIVALSWFGVNLLNVGLHSYGFTSEALLGLVAFCLIELLLISGLYIWRKRSERTCKNLQ